MTQELIVAVAAAILAMAVFVIGDRLRPKSWRHTGDEAAGTLVLDLSKTFFTAVVAFVVVICWQQFQNAHSHTVTEAKGLVDAYWAAHFMPEPDQQRIEGLLQAYTHQVVSQDWPMMNQHGRLSPTAQHTLDTAREAVTAVRSTDPVVTDQRSRALASLEKVAEARSDRTLDQGHSISGFLNVVLLFGTVLLLLNPVLSGVRVSWRSVVMTGLLGVVVGSALLEIHKLDQPYAGVVVVSHDAFDQALSRYQQISSVTGNE
ncbi:hypothetical protein ABIA39_000522 [Nocardia sp. GAS34]|uniref:bestrophin-like domain n=1 Tax=unclassified Nocardia TaxID=2637762 RepID=UPI003D1E3567